MTDIDQEIRELKARRAEELAEVKARYRQQLLDLSEIARREKSQMKMRGLREQLAPLAADFLAKIRDQKRPWSVTQLGVIAGPGYSLSVPPGSFLPGLEGEVHRLIIGLAEILHNGDGYRFTIHAKDPRKTFVVIAAHVVNSAGEAAEYIRPLGEVDLQDQEKILPQVEAIIKRVGVAKRLPGKWVRQQY